MVFFHQSSWTVDDIEHSAMASQHHREPHRASHHLRHTRLQRIIDDYADLKLCAMPAGTPLSAPPGWTRLARPEEGIPPFDDSRSFLQNAPSEYLSRDLLQDSCTYTKARPLASS